FDTILSTGRVDPSAVARASAAAIDGISDHHARTWHADAITPAPLHRTALDGRSVGRADSHARRVGKGRRGGLAIADHTLRDHGFGSGGNSRRSRAAVG